MDAQREVQTDDKNRKSDTTQSPQFNRETVDQVRNHLTSADRSTTLEIVRESLKSARGNGIKPEEIRSVVDDTWGPSNR